MWNTYWLKSFVFRCCGSFHWILSNQILFSPLFLLPFVYSVQGIPICLWYLLCCKWFELIFMHCWSLSLFLRCSFSMPLCSWHFLTPLSLFPVCPCYLTNWRFDKYSPSPVGLAVSTLKSWTLFQQVCDQLWGKRGPCPSGHFNWISCFQFLYCWTLSHFHMYF